MTPDGIRSIAEGSEDEGEVSVQVRVWCRASGLGARTRKPGLRGTVAIATGAPALLAVQTPWG